MTINKIDQISSLINNQKTNIISLKAKFEIALSSGFLDNRKYAIYEHLSTMDDLVDKIEGIAEEIETCIKTL